MTLSGRPTGREGAKTAKGPKPDMKALGLLLGISMAAGIVPLAGADGCQYDMQCKGERICVQGQCVSADRNLEPTPRAPAAPTAPTAPKSAPRLEQPAKAAPPATRTVPPPAPPPPAKAAQVTRSVPPSEPLAPAERPAMTSPPVANSPAPSTGFRFCCTKVGKFPIDPEASEEGTALKPGDTCHGITSYGTPLPGIPCN